jgi:ABC-type uncharacterized transport system involved in gliding motility auxiliary subunit
MVRTRQARYGSNALLLSASVGGILLLLNVAAGRSPLRWDLTEDREYSLSPETVLVLAELPGPAELRGFYTSELASSRDDLRPLLEEYATRSDGKLSFTFVDPNEDPLAAEQFGVTRDGSMVVILGERSEVVQFPNEQEITSALVRLANPGERRVYFLTGHGEADVESLEDGGYGRAREALVSKNYQVESLNLLAEHEVPEGALAVVIAGATRVLSEAEVETLRQFSEQGGALIVLAQPSAETEIGEEADPMAAYLAEAWGLVLNDDVVVDLRSAQALLVFAADYPSHPISDRLQRVGTYYAVVRSLALAAPEDFSFTLTGLVQTSDSAWGETDLETLISEGRAEVEDGVDYAGPLLLAAAGENALTRARLVVFGDSDFAANVHFFNYANGDMLVNSIDWATGQEGLIDLTPKQPTQRFVVPPSSLAQRLILLLTVFAIPGTVSILGVRMALQRRRRA